jgi:hypothetical protein
MELNNRTAGFIREISSGASAGYGIHVQLQNSAETPAFLFDFGTLRVNERNIDSTG